MSPLSYGSTKYKVNKICECEWTIESNFEQFSKGQIMEFWTLFCKQLRILKGSDQWIYMSNSVFYKVWMMGEREHDAVWRLWYPAR